MNEYFLVGSVLDTVKDGFLEILRGLCDNPENKPIEFLETEYIFSKINPNGSSVSLRARRVGSPPDQTQHCHLKYVGGIDQKTDKVMVRTYNDCLTSPNLNEYLMALGFNLETELIVKGYLFHKGHLKVVVSKIFQPSSAGEPQPVSNSHLVEISRTGPPGQTTMGESVKQFADLFKPFVRMERVSQVVEELNF
ncbi:unnamed protein product [Brachionus calyciflorus]|uniref:Mediator of RNA polymerase II transcription subunit 18 n=1 Tax=Brachionus calyciflorus TaxID=104777 RepID=A0A814I3Z0_9BILA|nr:unnamed protein product [Brachionus calyciflorus]